MDELNLTKSELANRMGTGRSMQTDYRFGDAGDTQEESLSYRATPQSQTRLSVKKEGRGLQLTTIQP